MAGAVARVLAWCARAPPVPRSRSRSLARRAAVARDRAGRAHKSAPPRAAAAHTAAIARQRLLAREWRARARSCPCTRYAKRGARTGGKGKRAAAPRKPSPLRLRRAPPAPINQPTCRACVACRRRGRATWRRCARRWTAARRRRSCCRSATRGGARRCTSRRGRATSMSSRPSAWPAPRCAPAPRAAAAAAGVAAAAAAGVAVAAVVAIRSRSVLLTLAATGDPRCRCRWWWWCLRPGERASPGRRAGGALRGDERPRRGAQGAAAERRRRQRAHAQAGHAAALRRAGASDPPRPPRGSAAALSSSRTDVAIAPSGLALQGGHVETVRLLLRKRASVAAQNKRGQTPLDVAASDEVRAALRADAPAADDDGDGDGGGGDGDGDGDGSAKQRGAPDVEDGQPRVAAAPAACGLFKPRKKRRAAATAEQGKEEEEEPEAVRQGASAARDHGEDDGADADADAEEEEEQDFLVIGPPQQLRGPPPKKPKQERGQRERDRTGRSADGLSSFARPTEVKWGESRDVSPRAVLR
eukprot:scaffold4946_cov266-Prasinococcus_capsulatus_cf.AAC.1